VICGSDDDNDVNHCDCCGDDDNDWDHYDLWW
jgi:hypothetical protein